jgi:hypothetical protein
MRSRTAGIPSGRFSLLPSLAIHARRTGCGRYVPSRSCSCSRPSSASACRPKCATVCSSAPALPPLRHTFVKALSRLAGAYVLSSKLNQTWFAGSPPVSRVNMRSVQTHRSTHHHGARASPACLGAAATAAGRCSLVWFISHPPSCVPSLHGRYPLRRYYGRSVSRRAALRTASP